jgi:hypothetical protein
MPSRLQPHALQAVTPCPPGDPRIEDEVVDMLRQMLTEESRALQEGATPLLATERHAPRADARAAAADAAADAAAAAADAAAAEAKTKAEAASGGGSFSTVLANFFAAGESVGDSMGQGFAAAGESAAMTMHEVALLNI